MLVLKAKFTKQFQRDVKRLERRHVNLAELSNVINLVLEDTAESKETLRRRHRAHRLQGSEWGGAIECHVGNAGGGAGSLFGCVTMELRCFCVPAHIKELFGKD